MCNPIILVRNDLINFNALINVSRQYKEYLGFSGLIDLVIVKWHSQFTEQLIVEFNVIIWRYSIEYTLLLHYLFDKLTLSVISKFNNEHIRKEFRANLIKYTIHRDIDKALDMIQETGYLSHVNDIYAYCPTSEITYKICNILLTMVCSDNTMINILRGKRSTITPIIENLFRKHGKYHVIREILNPWPDEDNDED
jgi:hypothetical protein